MKWIEPTALLVILGLVAYIVWSFRDVMFGVGYN